MFQHELVEAIDAEQLLTKLSLDSDSVKTYKPISRLVTRQSALEYLEQRLHLLGKFKAIAVPVQLPSSAEYRDAQKELKRLVELAKSRQSGPARGNVEAKIAQQSELLRSMESTAENRNLYWSVYRAKEQSIGQPSSNRRPFQPNITKPPFAKIHAQPRSW